MRGGPSTGLPTQPSQSDVMQARWGTHGDHPVIALSPSSVKETFDLTIQCVNLAEKFRVPVILLMDEVIAHLRERVTLPKPESVQIEDRPRPTCPPEWYKPYEDTGTGVPPMADFGTGYRYHITGLTHDEMGFPTTKTHEVDQKIRRLFRKIRHGLKDIIFYEEFLMEDAEKAIVAYGCVYRAAKSAVLKLRERGFKVGLVKLTTIWPFPGGEIESVADRVKEILVPEMNMGQIYREVQRVSAGKATVKRYTKVDGTMITPEEIIEAF